MHDAANATAGSPSGQDVSGSRPPREKDGAHAALYSGVRARAQGEQESERGVMRAILLKVPGPGSAPATPRAGRSETDTDADRGLGIVGDDHLHLAVRTDVPLLRADAQHQIHARIGAAVVAGSVPVSEDQRRPGAGPDRVGSAAGEVVVEVEADGRQITVVGEGVLEVWVPEPSLRGPHFEQRLGAEERILGIAVGSASNAEVGPGVAGCDRKAPGERQGGCRKQYANDGVLAGRLHALPPCGRDTLRRLKRVVLPAGRDARSGQPRTSI